MNNTTAIIVIKDNPPHLMETLQSIRNFATEIIIGTVTVDPVLLAQLEGDKRIRLVNLPSNIAYADLVKEDLKKLATGNYILYLDPDEIFPKDAIKVIEKKINEFDYFCFPRRNIIFGKWIKHSRWWPDYQVRFFKKNMVVWLKKIHPEPVVRGIGYTMPIDEHYALLHYNYDNIDQYFEKALRYAKAEARSFIDKHVVLTLPETVRKSVSEFISRFFACEGYKDGAHGFVLAVLQMCYYFFVYIYYWEAKRYEKVDGKILIQAAQTFARSASKEMTYWMIQKELINKAEQWRMRVLNKIFGIFKY